VRIVTFNVKHGSVGNGRSDNRLLATTCAGLEADILALQEVDRRATRSRLADQVGRVARATGMSAAFGEAARRGPLRRYGNVLLARGALSEVETLGLPQPESREFRVAVLARVILPSCQQPGVAPSSSRLSLRSWCRWLPPSSRFVAAKGRPSSAPASRRWLAALRPGCSSGT